MRCSCHECGTYMNQSEGLELGCVCPECGYRCNACLGTASMITREQLEKLKNTDWFTPQFDRPLNDEEAEESEVDHP